MRDYLLLETDILSKFKDSEQNENNPEIMEFLGVFENYWRLYQDNWPPRYWEIYNSIYKENEEKNKLILNVIDTSQISEKEFKNGIDFEKFLKESDKLYQNKQLTEKLKFNSTKDYTKSVTNLEDIDKDLEEAIENSIIMDKKPEKNRSCIDCKIF